MIKENLNDAFKNLFFKKLKKKSLITRNGLELISTPYLIVLKKYLLA